MHNKNIKKGLWFNKLCLFLGRKIFGKAILKKSNAIVEKYTPKSKTFIIIANHTDIMDPAYEMMSLNRYIRFVSADFLVRNRVSRFFIKTLGGSIIKYHDMSSEKLMDEILCNVKSGIPVAIHAEGRITTNGETGHISENTGRLVKESGVSLITYRVTGAYLRKPRWAINKRSGRVYGKVVNEYSPSFLNELTPVEIAGLIKRDIYVNAFEVQKAENQRFAGENLAEKLEYLLYMCPECKNISSLKSEGNKLFCSCGYSVIYGENGFFHKCKGELYFDNLLSWDKWQTAQWIKRINNTKTGCICSELGQIVKEIDGINENLLSDNAMLELFPDGFKIKTEFEQIFVPIAEIKTAKLSSADGLILVTSDKYYFISSQFPRSAEKYEEAYRELKKYVN